MAVDTALSIADLAEIARRRLPASIYGYVDGGSEDRYSLDENRAAFRRWRFRPQPLIDVSARSQSVELFGVTQASPVGVAPMGVSGLCWFEGDVALARAAAASGVPSILSAASTVPLERVMAEAPNTWYQAYLSARTEVIGPLLERVRAAGVQVLVVTVDLQVSSTRENELRNGFSIPLKMTPRLMAGGLVRPRWLAGTFARTLVRSGIPHFENLTAARGGPITVAPSGDHRASRAALDWNVVQWIRDRWPGKLVLKGILRGDDASRACAMGCDGVLVSNHGGRQLDGAIATLDALPEVVEAVPARFPVMLDGGVRRGTDVLKALALGAHYVFVGRPAMYGLAAAGERGAVKALALIRREIDTNLALLGRPDVRQLSRSDLAYGVGPYSAPGDTTPR